MCREGWRAGSDYRRGGRGLRAPAVLWGWGVKRGTPISRKAPLKRSAPLRKKRAAPRRSRVQDAKYLAAVRRLPCAAHRYTLGSCAAEWVYHAHHMGPRGLGQRCSDYEAVSLCSRHHRDWHDCTGMFRGWTKEQRQEFAVAAIALTQGALGYPIAWTAGRSEAA